MGRRQATATLVQRKGMRARAPAEECVRRLVGDGLEECMGLARPGQGKQDWSVTAKRRQNETRKDDAVGVAKGQTRWGRRGCQKENGL